MPWQNSSSSKWSLCAALADPLWLIPSIQMFGLSAFLVDHEHKKYQCWQLATCLHDIITSNSLICFWRGLWLVITCQYFFIWDSYFTSFGWQRTNITQYSSSSHLPPLLSSSFGESTSAYTCNFDPCITPHNFWQCASSLHGLSYLLSSHGSCWSYMIVSILGV